MNQSIQWTRSGSPPSPFQRWWRSRDFIQQRLIRFCLSLLVMVLCFPLYYQGIFGNVEGPLNPGRIGEHLAGLGVTRIHCLILFTSLLVIAVSWNWIFNLVSLKTGARLTCKRTVDDDGTICGQAVRRSTVIHKRTGQPRVQYTCTLGHRLPEAHFHPVTKGAVSHSLWLICLGCCIIVLFMS